MASSAEGAKYNSQGKREARRPWLSHTKMPPRPEGPKYVFRPFRAGALLFINVTRGDALRACPWLLYFAPSALLVIKTI
jgi:hypothetical protein